ncbi:hypothetical protein [Albidovulum sp.]|uniref:hypothetical protein n=1 Tax=Albidovulum sp. TaxID=1872424 RepID=UPI003D7D69EB
MVLLLCLMPLFVSPVLPLIDFYAHTLRYDILADGGRDPTYAENYRIAWKLLPNLGLDVIGTGLFAILPATIASRILLMIVVAAPVLGVMSLSWSLFGRVAPLNAALAGIVAHNFVFGWGFANFLLGFSLALAGLGFWIANAGAPRRQLFFSTAFAVLIFFTHGFVFAIWGLMLFAVEAMASVSGGRLRPGEVVRRGSRLLIVAALPVLLFLATSTVQGSGGVTDAVSNLAGYSGEGNVASRVLQEIWLRIDSGLRASESNWPTADRLFGLVLWGLIGFGLLARQLRIDRRLWLVVPLMALLAIIVPPAMFGVGHLPERLPIVLLAVIAAGLSVSRDKSGSRTVTRAIMLLLPVHLFMVTLGWAQERQGYARFLALAETLPEGGLATVAYGPGVRERDEMRSCKPFTFLLSMSRGIAVPTFANETEQPLEIIGPLAAAMTAYAARAVQTPDLNGTAQVRAMLDAGYNMVVLCEGRYISTVDGTVAGARPVKGAEVVGAGKGWTLYRDLPG